MLRNQNLTLVGTGGKSVLNTFINWQTTPEELERYILEEFRVQLKDKLQGLDLLIQARLKELLRGAIERSSVYDALVNKNQPLYFELGAIDSPEALHELIAVIQKTVYVTKPNVRKLGNRINMSIGCSAINSDFSEALSVGVYDSVNRRGQTTKIPWMEWLLKSPPYIRGWNVKFGDFPNTYSRTGGAIMIEVQNGGWKLPIEFAGTLQDNFVTRAVEEYNVSGQLDKYIQQTIEILLR